jgi:dephospho-CoA kinase
MTQGPLVVAITGGIGSGKSMVARLFESWGAAVVDADVLARAVVEPGSPGLAAIQQAFAPEPLILADGSLNRPKLASIIFADPDEKKKLESILHPLIRKSWLAALERLKKQNPALIAYVVPLFFESAHSMPEIEKVILVSAPEEQRLSRVMARDGFSREAVELRFKAQLPDSQKANRSDFVIINDGTVEQLTQRCRAVYDTLTAQARKEQP